jgi:phage protein U
MADDGAAWPLVEGTGWYYGAFVITAINERTSRHFKDGAPAQIEFTLSLARVDDHATDRLGRLDSGALRLALESLGS